MPHDPALPPRIATLRFTGKVTVGDRARIVDGVDRLRGFIPACGGRGGDTPTEKPNATLVCHDPNELIAYDRGFGDRTRAASGGVEVTVRGGRATAVSRRRGSAWSRRLLRDGSADIDAAAEGYRPANDPGWGRRIADRNPRTMAGIDRSAT